MLLRDPNVRPTAIQCLEFPWFAPRTILPMPQGIIRRMTNVQLQPGPVLGQEQQAVTHPGTEDNAEPHHSSSANPESSMTWSESNIGSLGSSVDHYIYADTPLGSGQASTIRGQSGRNTETDHQSRYSTNKNDEDADVSCGDSTTETRASAHEALLGPTAGMPRSYPNPNPDEYYPARQYSLDPRLHCDASLSVDAVMVAPLRAYQRSN